MSVFKIPPVIPIPHLIVVVEEVPVNEFPLFLPPSLIKKIYIENYLSASTK
jgi:hypothetical protein